jgi:hypothetical protein
LVETEPSLASLHTNAVRKDVVAASSDGHATQQALDLNVVAGLGGHFLQRNAGLGPVAHGRVRNGQLPLYGQGLAFLPLRFFQGRQRPGEIAFFLERAGLGQQRGGLFVGGPFDGFARRAPDGRRQVGQVNGGLG